MQTSDVTARSCITNLAASNASDAVKPGMTSVPHCNDFRRRLGASAQALDRGVVDRLYRALACVWHGEEFRLRVESPDTARRAAVPSLQDVPDMAWASHEPALSEHQGHGRCVGPVR